MKLKNNDEQYGVVSRINHWVTAGLFIAMVALGIYMHELPKDAFRAELYGIHKSLGVLILALVIFRFMWLKVSPNPSVIAPTRVEYILAHSVKGILYLGLVLMPLSGWVMSSSGGHDVSFFGWFTLPAIVPENDFIHELAEQGHGLLGSIILPLVVLLHIAAALKHHFVTKDETLSRMTGLKAPKMPQE